MLSESAESGATTVERLIISVAAVAAITCTAILIVLMLRTNKSRIQLQQDSVGEFNFVQQIDHNLDLLSNAAMDYRVEHAAVLTSDLADASAPPLERSDELIKRFDVLYSAMSSVGKRWAGSSLYEATGPATVEQLQTFVASYDQRVLPGVTLSDAELAAINWESRRLARMVYDLGLVPFQRKSEVRDDISSRLDWLIGASWFFGISFLLAAITLYLLLARASLRAGKAVKDARSIQRQLETALE